MKNKYIYRSKISEAKFCEIVRLFCFNLTATQASQLGILNRNTFNKLFHGIRERIAQSCEIEFSLSGEIEVNESYFGAKRVKGLRGRCARGKTIVFGIFNRKEKVYTEIVPNCSSATLQGIIRGKVDPESVIHSDGWRGYNGLVDLGYKKHFRVQHGENEFANESSHINGIESFWGYVKTRLVRFRGMNKSTFYLHLKECEFRFNNRQKNLYPLILNMCREKPLS